MRAMRRLSIGVLSLALSFAAFERGVTGVLISGIMFGVRKGKLRRLEDRMAYEKSRAIRWDPHTSRFVF